MKKNNNLKPFFEEVASYYDSMVNFTNNLSRRFALLSNFAAKNGKTAADLGCGSGIDSIALSKIGYQVTGFDNSIEMIKKAKLNAERMRCKVKFINSSIETIEKCYFGKFDFVVSLGNTLANLNTAKLKRVFSIAYKMLNENGNFLIQLVNINMMKLTGKRIIGITRDTKNTYIRFYDYEKNRIMFYILRIGNFSANDYQINSTQVYSHHSDMMCKIAHKTGFKSSKIYGGLDKTKFIPNISSDLVIFFRK